VGEWGTTTGSLVDVVVETAVPLDGTNSWVEASVGGSAQWEAARPVADNPRRWRYLWADPPLGRQTLRIRAVGMDPAALPETTLTVDVTEPDANAVAIANPYDTGGGRYYRGQLHDHSTWSFDGWNSLPPKQLAEEYRRLGYDWVAVTDHDVVANPSELNSSMFSVVRGYESTSDTGHIIGLFTDTAVNPDLRAQQRIDGIRDAGGLAILAHPGWTTGWSDTAIKDLRGYTAMEIFNGMTTGKGDVQERNLQKWHEELKVAGRTRPIWGVAVDDSHRPSELNKGWVMTKLPKIGPSEIRAAIERGAFYASNGPNFTALGVANGEIAASSSDAAKIRFIDQDFKVVAEGPPGLATYRPTGRELFVRIEAVTADGKTAWSQPFFIG
jgi:hypothetical protein